MALVLWHHFVRVEASPYHPFAEPKEKGESMSPQANWTLLVYMAGDNNLEGAGLDDLQEMQQVGSTPEVNVIVQFDTEKDKTIRYKVGKGTLQELAVMPGVDCGDPAVLTEFIRWGMESYPADRYLLDVWNHGGGWENLPADFNYDSIRTAKPLWGAKLNRVKRSLFRGTAATIDRRPGVLRAIAIDCGSQDYLDNAELHHAVADAMPNGRKLDILGCDACLMNMIEIAYEMSDTVDFMVGSEETEPGTGWPYADILQALTSTPTMSPAELAKTIAVQYGAWYKANGDLSRDRSATQSALDLGQMGTASQLVNALADALLKGLKKSAGGISLARDKALHFEYPEYKDLGSFCDQLQQWGTSAPIKAAAKKLKAALVPGKKGSLILANATWGSVVKEATGVSIYFPAAENYSKDYATLLLSKDGKWRKFLEAYNAM
jgi:hypothetical protein